MRAVVSFAVLLLVAAQVAAQSARERQNQTSQPLARDTWKPQWSTTQLHSSTDQPLVNTILRRRWSQPQVQNTTSQPLLVGAIVTARWSPSQEQNQIGQSLDSATSTLHWSLHQAQRKPVQTLVSLSAKTTTPPLPVQRLVSATSRSDGSPARNEKEQIPVSVNSTAGWSSEASARSYHTLPNDVLDNDVDSRKAPVAVGTAEYAPLSYDHDYYRNRYSGKYQQQEGENKKAAASNKQPVGGHKYGAKKQKGAAVDDYPTGPAPRERLGFEDDDDYEDHEGGYGYGYVEEDGYYEHGDDYHPRPHHARPAYHGYHGYHGPPVYVPPRHHHHGDKYLKFGILALLKLILAKLKAFGLFKLLLLFIVKPILLFKLALKFLFITKAFNLLTLAPLLLLPLLLLPLLLVPLLFPLAPLLLLPLLLPLLLLFLPVPVLTPGAGAPPGRRRRRRATADAAGAASPDLLLLTRQVLEADQCLERIACQLAARRSSLYNRFVIWLLERFEQWVAPERVRPRLTSYLGAYRQGAEVPDQCRPRYQCDGGALPLPQGSLLHQLI